MSPKVGLPIRKTRSPKVGLRICETRSPNVGLPINLKKLGVRKSDSQSEKTMSPKVGLRICETRSPNVGLPINLKSWARVKCRFADLQIGVGNMQILNADWSEFYPLAKSASHRVKCRLDCLIIWYVG